MKQKTSSHGVFAQLQKLALEALARLFVVLVLNETRTVHVPESRQNPISRHLARRVSCSSEANYGLGALDSQLYTYSEAL